jgi:hypothetical protein
MKPVRRVGALIAWSMVLPLTVATLGAVLQVDSPETNPPTPIEQALMEHVCSVVPSGGAPESDRYLACLRTQLLTLRTDFGRDLSRLSAVERRAVDSACNEVRTSSGRDAYLECLGAQLNALRLRRNRGKPAPPPPVVPPPPDGSAATAPAPAPPATRASSGFSGLLIGAIVLAAALVAGGVVLFLKTRRVSHTCRVCGSEVPAAGDLCQKCRHEAAEAVRRAAAERAEQQRAQEQEERRQKEQEAQEAEERRRQVQQDEDARLMQQQRQQEEEARKRAAEERRLQEEEARARRTAADVPDEEFDPYAVLELPHGSSTDDIRAAYEGAKAKCDPDLVSHLGYEVREHFEAKLQAVERAFQMLTG